MAKETEIVGVIKKPGQKAFVYPFIKNELEALQKLVGGYIEAVTMDDCMVLCNEEGWLLNLPMNCRFRNVDFIGPIVVVGTAGGEFASLHAHNAELICKELNARAYRVPKSVKAGAR